jgi:hypothetical protein
MLMGRYRFVDENLTIGKPETEHVVMQARANFKLWYCIEANRMQSVEGREYLRLQDHSRPPK